MNFIGRTSVKKIRKSLNFGLVKLYIRHKQNAELGMFRVISLIIGLEVKQRSCYRGLKPLVTICFGKPRVKVWENSCLPPF